MFRQSAEARSVNYLSDITKNAAIIQSHKKNRSIDSILSVLVHNINKFEKHRYIDYINNKSERGLQVLHAAAIYHSHYHKHLAGSPLHQEATILEDSLSAYEDIVMQHLLTIECDLSKIRDSLMLTHENNLATLERASEQQAIAAATREAMVDSLLFRTTDHSGYDYFGVSDLTFPPTFSPEEDSNLHAFGQAAIIWNNPYYQPSDDDKTETELLSVYSGYSRSDEERSETISDVSDDDMQFEQSLSEEIFSSNDEAQDEQNNNAPRSPERSRSTSPSAFFSSRSPSASEQGVSFTDFDFGSETDSEDYSDESAPLMLRKAQR